MNDPKAAAAYHPGDAPVTRTTGPLEQHAIDTAPFDGLAQHYYVLYLRGADEAKEMQTALAAETARAEQAEARLANAPHAEACWINEEPSLLPACARPCDCWKREATA